MPPDMCFRTQFPASKTPQAAELNGLAYALDRRPHVDQHQTTMWPQSNSRRPMTTTGKRTGWPTDSERLSHSWSFLGQFENGRYALVAVSES
jgi:hypothetical protein